MSAFNRATFEAAFAVAIIALASSERTTKEELRVLSRTVLEAVHTTGDIAYVNKLIEVLSPVNKKAARVYFLHFTGFALDEASGLFVSKSKKRYEKAKELSDQFLTDPNNNLWSWAERNIEVQKKDFDIKQVTKAIENFIGTAKKNGLSELDVLRAAFAGGFTPELLIQMLGEVGYEVENKEGAQ